MTIDARTYPLPRKKRTGPASNLDTLAAAAGAVSLSPPRSRLVPWLMSITGTSRRTISSPILTGPAILRKITYEGPVPTSPPAQSLELGWAPSIVTEAGVALTTVRPYTVLTEKQDPFAVALATIGQGIPLSTNPNTRTWFEYSCDLIVTETRFVFTVSWVNNAATAEERPGHMLILENVNPDALMMFTGS